jgi:cytochrome c-type biogenesis protein CcmE
MREAVVYFQTASEIKNHPQNARGRFLRLGGQVVPGSLRIDKGELLYVFDLTDGVEQIRVHFKGIPPDLFREGKGAVVEGKLSPDGTFAAITILAKHAEEYTPPQEGKPTYPHSFVLGAGEKRP